MSINGIIQEANDIQALLKHGKERNLQHALGRHVHNHRREGYACTFTMKIHRCL
ncbi:hypothetical protein NC652_009840 [Populus alba x Populus x berolinensis]|nr:hypothetical protein NC652_009840 [Populus alba x Populus x berolinensis]